MQTEKPRLVLCWTFSQNKYKIAPSETRAWYNGSTSASQAEDEGSIPFARTKNKVDLVSAVFLACDDGREPDQRVRKQVGKTNEVLSSRHGFPAGI